MILWPSRMVVVHKCESRIQSGNLEEGGKQMITTYAAPKVTLYGSITVLTESAKCTPGSDIQSATNRTAKVDFTGGPNLMEGATLVWLDDGVKVPTGADCISGIDGSFFSAP